MASALHPPTYTIQVTGRCGVDHSIDHATRIAFAVILSSQQVASATIHNAGEACTASDPQPAACKWVAALKLLLLSVAA